MNTREQFGSYLLLKKLTEDPLGETFRAGMVGGKGMERVALLRIFNGQGLDGQRLWSAASSRAPIQQVLKSPNLAEGIEMGEIQGLPYVAYEYISGKNLATLFDQAAAKRSFIPTEHALLITERIALGLAVAIENRLGSDRILHGFLVPHLVMISNEGETRLLGFEVAPALRTFAGNPVIRQHFGRYLAPEAMNGAPAERSDDIYSLGVLLFELLTGQPLPPPGADGFASIIDRAVLATEGTALPPELGQLLKQSLVPREHRMKDVIAWHKALNRWMFEGRYNPTTFNLAFFMHNLFRQDIEQESQEIEVEKTLPLPVMKPEPAPTPEPAPAAPPTPPPTAAPVAPPQDSGPIPEDTGHYAPFGPIEKKSKRGPLIGVALGLLLLLGGLGGYFWWTSQQASREAQQAAAVPPPPPPPVLEPEPIAEPEPAGPTAEEIQTQIDDLVSQQASAIEAELRRRYDEQLKQLQNQLDETKSAAEERERRSRERREAEAARLAAEETAARQDAAKKEEPQVAAAATDGTGSGEDPAAQAEAEGPTAGTGLQTADVTPPVAASSPPPPPPEPEPAPPTTRVGELVEPGPGVVGPKLVRHPQPRFPPLAKRLNRSGVTVVVKVLVDENGRVSKAELANKKVGYGFDDEALQVARKAQYEPPSKDGVLVKMWASLVIRFE